MATDTSSQCPNAIKIALAIKNEKEITKDTTMNTGFKRSKMRNLNETLRSKKISSGHFSISIEMDGKEFNTTTTNTTAIDAAFDDSYDDEDNSGRYYESSEEAQIALVGEILASNEIEL